MKSSPHDASTDGAPVLDGFDPLAPEQAADPFPLLARARREIPVFFDPKYDLWFVTRMAEVLEVFGDSARFSNSHEEVGKPPPAFAQALPDGHPVSHSLDTIDPPAHTRLRRLAQRAFTPKQVAAREPHIRAIVDDLIDGFVDARRADLISSFTSPIPVRVIAFVLGAGEEHVPGFKQWTDDWFQIWGHPEMPAQERDACWRRTLDFDRFIRAFVDDRRARPRDDLTSELVHAKGEEGEPSLSTSEVVAVIAGIVAAGSDTTSILLVNAIHELLAEPQQWEAVKADPTRIPLVIEETLRLHNPVRGLRRVTNCRVHLAGVPIPEGAALQVHIGSANRDENVFAEPDRFDPTRPDLGEHVGLGKGIHFCLGAPLARLEARVALEQLAARVPSLRLAQGPLEIEPNIVIPVPRRLLVEWD